MRGRERKKETEVCVVDGSQGNSRGRGGNEGEKAASNWSYPEEDFCDQPLA